MKRPVRSFSREVIFGLFCDYLVVLLYFLVSVVVTKATAEKRQRN